MLMLFIVISTFMVSKITSTETGQLMCNETSMMLTFNKTVLDSRERNYTIKFADNTVYPCFVDNHQTKSIFNGSNIWIKANYNECGIGVYEDGSSIVYNHTIIITYGKNPINNNLVFREEYDGYKVQCRKWRNFTEAMNGKYVNVIGKDTIDYSKVGNATFDVSLDRYIYKAFKSIDFSGKSKLGKMMYFQMELTNPREDIKMSPQNCYATTVDGASKYYLIKEKCAEDDTTEILSTASNKKLFQWKNEAFKFVGQSDKIYIQCDVYICTVNNTDKSCARCGDAKRKRRDVSTLNSEIQSSTIVPDRVIVRSSLIVLVDEDKNDLTIISNKSTRSPSIFSGTTGTILIVLLTAVIILLFFVVIKKCVCRSVVTEYPNVEFKAV